MKLKVGSRYYSAACSTQVIVVKTPNDDVELTCGGHLMSETDPSKSDASPLELASDERGGTLLGRRYRDPASSVELLAVKGGDGSLALDDVPLKAEQAKALPASD